MNKLDQICWICDAQYKITMGGSPPSAPTAPDPNAVAGAQTQSNQATALFNFGLNNPTLNTPLGDINYSVDNSNPNQPTSTANVTLSPAEQQILQQNQGNVIQQGQNAQTAQGNVTNLLQTPYNLQGNVSPTLSQQDQQGDLQNAENSLYQQQEQYLQPQQQQATQQLQSQLADQGIPMGSAAYNTAMKNNALQNQQANQSALNSATSGGAAYQAQLAQTGLANQAQQAQLYTQQYQEPLSLYSTLMNGTAPTLPQFSGVNQASAAPTNVLGAYQNSYQDQLNAYNSQVGSQNSATSGLFGLGGAALGNSSVTSGLGSAAGLLALSDRRLKKNVTRVGETGVGIPIYKFQYVWERGDEIHYGCMADEVKKVIPCAVHQHESGFAMVNYGAIK